MTRRSCALADLTREASAVVGEDLSMRGRRSHRRPAAARWREACVDGVLHVAYAAAVRAESAAERCLPSGLRPRRERRTRRHPGPRRG
jgi:hypothetical protein